MNKAQETTALVSIVLCTYNGERFLAEQINSLLRQTYKPLEIIISDDASADGTPAILQSFESHPNFRIFYQPKNIGYAQNFAFALQQATGNYIALCDQDDVWLPHKVETLLGCMGEQWLAYSDSLLINEAGSSMHKQLSDLRNMNGGRNTPGFFLFNVAWGHAIMLNQALLATALPIPNNIPHDIWLTYKAATLTGINYCPHVLTHYRQHPHAATQTLLPKKVPTRTASKRLASYYKQLYWLDVMRRHAQKSEQAFYNKFYTLFKQKENGKFSFALFLFLFQHQQHLYRFSKKSAVSRWIDMRKLSRGERNS